MWWFIEPLFATCALLSVLAFAIAVILAFAECPFEVSAVFVAFGIIAIGIPVIAFIINILYAIVLALINYWIISMPV